MPPVPGPLGSSLEQKALVLEVLEASGLHAPLLITAPSRVSRSLAKALHSASEREPGTTFWTADPTNLADRLARLSLGHFHDGSARSPQPSRATLYIESLERLTPASQELLMYFLDVATASACPCHEVRIVCSTTTDLSAAVMEGRFRADLFYRLNVIHIVYGERGPAGFDTAVMQETIGALRHCKELQDHRHQNIG